MFSNHYKTITKPLQNHYLLLIILLFYGALGSVYAADDHGNTCNTATAVNMATDTIGRLTDGDTDYFLITLTGPGRLNLFTIGGTNTEAQLFTADGLFLEGDRQDGQGDNFLISSDLKAGSYCLAIYEDTHRHNTIGVYSLRVEGDFANDDHGSSCDNAEIIADPRGTTITGELSVYRDVDYFRINTPSSGHITLYTNGSTDTTGQLFDINGIPLKTDYDAGQGRNFLINKELEAGSYCLAISGGVNNPNGIYSLRIEGDFSDDDHGTDCSSATVIDKTSTAGDLSVYADSDYFRIQIPESGGNLKIYTEGDTDTKGVLYDNNGVFLVSNSSSGSRSGTSGRNFYINTQLDAGNYCLEVSGESANYSGIYTLIKEGDKDTDGISDTEDNCPTISNADQLNADSDSEGDACDLDDDNDQMPDTWELLYGLNPLNFHDAAADKDGDGVSNLAEYLAGTNPILTPIDAAEALQESFIERFYQNILNRTADQGGLNAWLDVLQATSGSGVAFGFFNSQEFINLQLDNNDFVYILYSTLFDRLPDQGGYDLWMDKLEAGALREMVIYGFLKSEEFDNLAVSFEVVAFSESDSTLFQIKNFVQRFYQLVLNREPDAAGFNEWSTQLANPEGSRTGADIARGFFQSPEFTNRNTTDGEFIDIAYQSFFDRASDAGGKQSWMNELSTGASRDTVVNGFIGSQEFINLANRFGIRAN